MDYFEPSDFGGWVEEPLHLLLMNWGNPPVRVRRHLREPHKILEFTKGKTSELLDSLINSTQYHVIGQWWIMLDDDPTPLDIFRLGEKILFVHYCVLCKQKKHCDVHGTNVEYMDFKEWFSRLNREIRRLKSED